MKTPPKPPSKVHKSFAAALKGAWRTVARPEQLAPLGNWTTWVFCGGRGAGKTRSGAEWVCDRVAAGARYIHLVAPTAADYRDVMIEGPAGILSIAASNARPIYQPSLRKLVWPNGAQALCFSGDSPDTLRGPQADTVWVDELCAMRLADDVLSNMFFGLRLGKDPRCLITTTPRPIKCFKELLARDGLDVTVTRSSSYANRENLAPTFFAQIVKKYAGTRLGRQEIEAELLTDTPGSLWQLQAIEDLRVRTAPTHFERVVVAVDPAVTFGPDADETGIIVVGRTPDGQAYILDDLSGRYPPIEWATRAIHAYREHHADRIVAEVNQGGAMVETTLRSVDPGIPFKAVHASRGKQARAEPVSALYEQGRVHHVGMFGPLEDQMCTYDGSRAGASPDRLDALVWALTELMLGEPLGGYFRLASLLVNGAPAPLPLYPDCISVTMMLTDRPDSALGVCFWARSRNRGTPLTLLDYTIAEVDDALDDKFLPAVAKRALLLCELSQARNRVSPIWIEAEGLGETFIRQGTRAAIDVRAIPKQMLLPSLDDRALAIKGYVQSSRYVKIAAEAHDRIVAHRGVSKNHLLSQLLGFELGVKDQPAELVNAFCAGVALALENSSGRFALSDNEVARVMTPSEEPAPPSAEDISRQKAYEQSARDAATMLVEFRRRACCEVERGNPYPRSLEAVDMAGIGWPQPPYKGDSL